MGVQTDLWGVLYSEGDNRERLARLSTLLRRIMDEELTPRQREAFLLHTGQGLRQTEIAARWHVHPSVVCRHLQKAEVRLRRFTDKLERP
ncbi:MAG: hypothetical protein LBT60_04465 [Oscillospiraceae bacterium]|jgi:RNA polymerase sigma factor (sigma-70 family)|nr:hypothetical protein [Oscillospiraceae bacterium]